MAQLKTGSIPVLSILDRLSEPDSDNDAEVFLPAETTAALDKPNGHSGTFYAQKFVGLFEKSIKRDLEWLFNTRQTFDYRLADFPQLSSSVFAFGLPDTTTVSITSFKDLQRLAQVMQKTLEVFDSRFREVQIEIEPLTGTNRSLEFRIRGVLMMNPEPEEVVMEAVLDSSIGKYQVV